jgi:FAD/FMN-containing dehydrogenase
MIMTNHIDSQLDSQLDEQQIQAFTQHLRGELIRPGDASYDEARAVWNGLIDRYPALIARCTDSADVAAALNFARQHDLALAVRGGSRSRSTQPRAWRGWAAA